MKLSKFNYDLPDKQVALYPTENREDCRLMVINRKNHSIEHRIFKDIVEYFNDGDVMVLNNTKVFPARLYGNKEKTGAKIEVFLLRELNREQRLWDVLVDPARKIRIGNKLYFGEDDSLVAEVIDNTTSRGRTLRFLFDGEYDDFKKTLYSMGETPIPTKYINRAVTPEDKDRYQTIFAKYEGAVAAPAAGLHFSKTLLKRLELVGVNFAEITLHVGLGNFRSVDVEDLTKHKMDSEQIKIDDRCVEIVNQCKDNHKNVCAVGISSLRTLESSVSTNGYLKPFEGWTNKFIFPPYDFSVPSSLVTNFHHPFSTMLMTTSAFAGFDFLMEAYQVAIKEDYKFGPYGDAMLIM
ncbi:MAG: tRNA preQ1(34) S-adenosylmethionine ribosyltransferase-isomerase QueA [Bacteroidales bacterium]|nr:tRNA preQ1(34) S-adenosylmethionine ribosyltransferase-isomerase QueA [Bacteroidales bacterium]